MTPTATIHLDSLLAERAWLGELARSLVADADTVPGGNEGPGGVIVCSENFLVYKSPAQPERRCPCGARSPP